ncbi:MAG: hypothetical protein IIC01_10400, partial [Planctomycetes bacterium]|nr:hypothetical protein [Planctomycetota bacterium]
MNGSLETKPEQSSDPTTVSPSVRDRLVRLAYRFLWNRDDAEDAVQEALTVAHQKRSALRDSSKWWSWVRRIVVQQCRVSGRRSAMRRIHAERRASEGVGLTVESPDPTSPANNRYLSILPGNSRCDMALRVTFMQMPEGFDHLEGLTMWAGTPEEVCEHAGQAAPPPEGCAFAPDLESSSYFASELQCDPVFTTFGSSTALQLFDET